jgi:hypothetical protein
VPRVIVTIDTHANAPAPATAPVLLDELVGSVHIDNDHSARQFVERLGWAISDAERLEHAEQA